MGTYTANYQLYMPTIGEQGWGELINGNYQTIDTTMKGLSNRLTTCESKDTAFDSRITACEEILNSGGISGNIVANSVTATELCGKRVGVVTETAPNSWSESARISVSASVRHYASSGSGTASHSFSPLDNFKYWDDVDSSSTNTFTITVKSAHSSYYVKSFTVTFTDPDTGEVQTVSQTYSSSTSTTYEVIAKTMSDISISVSINTVSGTTNSQYSSVTVTSSDLYIKPKGT